MSAAAASAASRMRDSVERWIVHEGMTSKQVKDQENIFQIRIKHAGQHGVPVKVFEPKTQPGILVIGANVIMKNRQMARYSGFNAKEKKRFEDKVSDFCYSIQAISKVSTKDGKQNIGVYVVLDDKENINQQTFFDAIDKVSEMYEKTDMFLRKTF